VPSALQDAAAEGTQAPVAQTNPSAQSVPAAQLMRHLLEPGSHAKGEHDLGACWMQLPMSSQRPYVSSAPAQVAAHTVAAAG
jgi:hypothetical protein